MAREDRMRLVRFFTNNLIFIVPVALWLFIYRKALLGGPCMTRHGLDYYFIVKYYMENLIRGVFPLWDPFSFWGKADNLDMRFIGEFNPFLWLYPLFLKLGFSPPQSFIFYAIGYYFIGLIGFYLLAKRIFKDRLLACCAFVLFLFSSEVAPIFNNLCISFSGAAREREEVREMKDINILSY